MAQLTKDEQTVLNQLRRAKAEHPSFGVGTDPGDTLDGLLCSLERKGFVVRIADDTHGRWWQSR